MPKEMRFCRSCGNRLGEGPAEYTQTVRFPNTTGAADAGTTPFYPSVNAPLIQQSGNFRKRRRLGFTGMTWLWIVLGLFFLSGGVLSALRKNFPARPGITINRTRAYFGVDGFDTTTQGVTFDAVEPAGGPADKAGLVGGDIITSFDGQTVKTDSEMMELLRKTPVGKTVEVIYLRDGISRTTNLTTVSEDEFDRLRDVGDRPEGMFGFDRNRTERVSDPATKTYGVRLKWVRQNGPADLFGIREGDIITEFDKVPIRTARELESRVHRASPRSVVEVVVVRDGQTLKIPVTMGSS
ncbi:MAG TPA: PDZ domain-containing protein [Pyrinomonadaceae bacterium]|nr:PDZ domain-containing protein [Pyrinomonadaceae bacterium]